MRFNQNILMALAAATIFAGAAFKLQHWPGGQILLGTGMAGMVILAIWSMRRG